MKSLHALLFFIAFSSFAQIHFEEGYYIDNSLIRHDVLIRNVEWKNNPTSFDYKLSEASDIQISNIENTLEFGVGGTTYKRFKVKIDRSGSNTDRMSDSPVIDWKTEILLLKRLVAGKLSLYQYEDSNLVRYFYSEGEHTNATQLIFREYKQDGRIVPNNNFRQQLYSLMKDKYADAQKFENIKYTKNVLVKLFEDYNGISADSSKSNVKDKGKTYFNAAAGAAFSSIDATQRKNPDHEANLNGTSFRVGFQAEYVFPFNRNKWSLILDPNYQQFTIDETSDTDTWKVDYQRLEVPVLIRHYMYLNNKSRLFVNGAFILSFSLGDSYLQRNATIPIEITKASAWALGGGYSYSDFGLEARYVFKHGITDPGYWATNFGSVQLIFSYKMF